MRTDFLRKALNILLPFCTIHLCKMVFSASMVTKSIIIISLL